MRLKPRQENRLSPPFAQCFLESFRILRAQFKCFALKLKSAASGTTIRTSTPLLLSHQRLITYLWKLSVICGHPKRLRIWSRSLKKHRSGQRPLPLKHAQNSLFGSAMANPALNLAPFGRWTLRDKAAQRRLALR